MKRLTVHTPRGSYTARILPTDESWQHAAGRAIRRAYGRSAAAWRWNQESRVVDQHGDTIAAHWQATIVGPARRPSDGYPILCEARVTLEAQS